MTTIILALATSVLFGTGDFLGGIATRRDSTFAVTGTSHLLALVLLLPITLLFPPTALATTDVLWGAACGLAGVVGVLSLFSALSVGKMGIVAPVSAALTAALPAIFDLATGTSLSPVTLAGIGLAVVAIVIVSIAPDEQLHEPAHAYRPSRALGLAVLSGVGFSFAFIALSFTADASGFVPLVSARVVSVAVAVPLAYRFGSGFPVDRPALAPTLGAGLTDVAANLTMITAIRLGPLAIASVLSSLFPLVVVLLARVFLGERLHVWQKIGVVAAIVAVVLAAVP